MGNIRIFGKLLSILLAIILITAPISSALAAGYTRNNETSANDYNESIEKSIENTKITPDTESKNSSKTNNSDTRNYNTPGNDLKDTDEKSHNKLKNRLESLQPDFTSPLTLKQQAYGNLSSLNPVENKNNKDITKKLDKAKLYIKKSVASGLWYDKNHLKPVQESGDESTDKDEDSANNEDDSTDKDENDKEPGFDIKTPVFKSEKTSAQNILEIISKSKDQLLDDDILIETLINLVQADRNIAQTAITDALQATSRNGDNPKHREEHKNIEKAQKDFDKAIEKIQKGEPIDAIEHFEDAWEHATSEVTRLDAATRPVTVLDSIRGMYINRTNINLTGHVEDAAVYTLSNITLEVNGIPSTLNLTDGTFETALNLNEGKNHINATTIDNFGNTGTNNVTLIVDTILPVISYSGADDGRYYNTSVSVTANMTDGNPDTLIILVNGNPYTQNAPIIIEGTYRVDITARDLAGNTADSSFTFHIDMTPPAIRIIKPVNGSFISGTAAVNFTVTDISPVNTEVTADGFIPVTGIFDSTAYPDGVHYITVNAVDAAGNAATETVSFIVDNTKPEVYILEPGNNEAIRGFREIIARVYDLYLKGVTLFINNKPVSDTVNHTFDTLNYSDGNYTISAQGVDLANNTGYGSISVIVDNTPPVVNITSPSNSSFVKQQIEVNANITEANPDITNIRIDSVNVSGTLPYLLNTLSYPDGLHAIEVYLRDRAGNEASGSVDITIDNTRPEVNITSPVNASLVRGVINITADIYDINLENTTLAINGIFVTNNSTYSWNTTGYTDGWHTITAMAVDLAGNTAQTEVWVQVDNTPPALNVTELTNDPTLENPAYRINGTIEPGAILVINGATIPQSGSFEYRTNVTEGTNIITVTATDATGNIAVWTKTRLVDTDSLPDYYEINVTGTDPLNGDSDSNKTPQNEAGNGIKDDMEILGSAELPSVISMRIGANPLVQDTDNDGLTDKFELLKLGLLTNITSAYTNGVSDASADIDKDGLTNLAEQSYGTDPLVPDTDKDGLSDKEEITAGTNPLAKDTDGDGLDDDSELRLGTNPKNPDSNGNGVPDSKETYLNQKVTAEAATVVVDGVGDVSRNTSIVNASGYVALADMPGSIGKVVDVNTTAAFTSATISIPYNETGLRGASENDLKMYYINESDHSITFLDVQGADTANNVVWGKTNHFSTYGIVSYSSYMSTWNSGSNPTVPEYTYGNKINIKAVVYNTGDAAFSSNFDVYFYEGDPDAGGNYIGSATITGGISKGGGKTAILYGYAVKSSAVDIYVKVDPLNSITEKSESNNKAYKTLSIGPQNFDSDGDGLTDYDETNGMRTAFGIIKTDPNNQDTDGDGLSDAQEMGTRYNNYYYMISDPRAMDSDYDTISDADEPEFGTAPLNADSDYDKLNDGFELEIGTDPLISDTDYDGHNDYEEHYDPDYDPLVYEKRYSVLEIARDVGLGAFLGEWGANDNDSVYYMAGWMISGIAAVGDIRDITASIAKGDGLGTLLNALSLIPGYGDAAKVSVTISKFVAKHPNMMFSVATFALKYVDNSIDIVRKAYGDAVVDSLKAKGFSDDVIIKLFKEIDLKRFDDILTNSKIYQEFPGLPAFVRDELTLEGSVLKGRVTIDIKKMTAADAAGRSTAGYLGNLKGAYTEYLAKSDITGNTIIDLKHINKGGIDYAAKEGNVLKIVESKARQSLTSRDIKNYIKTDANGVIKEFNVKYTIKELGENYFKDASTNKQFILYMNGPNSQAIKNSLNLPASLPYEFSSKNPETPGQIIKGTIDIVVTAVNK